VPVQENIIDWPGKSVTTKDRWNITVDIDSPMEMCQCSRDAFEIFPHDRLITPMCYDFRGEDDFLDCLDSCKEVAANGVGTATVHFL
jgi:hypothetical protein